MKRPDVSAPRHDDVAVAAGRAAFETFYDAEFDPMVRVAFLIVGSTETAEELVQDAFIRVHQRWCELDTPQAYLRTAVVNGCRDRIRRRVRWRQRIPILAAEPNASAHSKHPEPSGERTDLVAALRTLPLRQRSALVLRFYGGFNEAEIATTLGVQPGTVKSLIHRGLENLRTEIEP